MKKTHLNILLAFGFCLTNLQSFAHHSFSATFKTDAKITIQGVVTDFKFRNPHLVVELDVSNDDGSTTAWVGEGQSATNSLRIGWTDSSVKAGDTIRVFGDSTHDGSPMIAVQRLEVLQNGEVVQTLYDEAQPDDIEPDFVPITRALTRADGQPNFSGNWTGKVGPYTGPYNPQFSFNEAGLVRQAAHQIDTDPQVFCEQPGLIRQAGITSYGIKIDQQEDHVYIEYEEYGYNRTIYFDDRDALGISTHFGDSIARYEGETLVIETTNLLPDLASPEGNRLSDQTTVVERYTRVDEPEYGPALQMQTIISDPVYLAQDFVLTNTKVAVPDQEFIENDCVAPLRDRTVVHPSMSFFLTSEGPGDGANLGGLQGADAHCSALAARVGQGEKDWRAYLSTTGDDGIDARDRIGFGPWYNAEGMPIARTLDELHGHADAAEWLNKATTLDERGREFYSTSSTVQDDGVNSRHDIITGTQLDGTAFSSDEDTTCENWTVNSGGGTVAGHADRRGGGPNPTSWVFAHPTRGCSPEELASSDGEGLFYCFAVDD